MSDDNTIDQSEVEKLLAGLGGSKPTVPPSGARSPATETSGATEASEAPTASESMAIDQSEVEALLSGKKNTQPASAQGKTVPPATASDSFPPLVTDQDASKVLGQGGIEKLLQGTMGAASPKPGAGIGLVGKSEMGSGSATHEENVPQGDIDYLLKRAEEALESITSNNNPMGMPPEVIEFQFPEFGGSVPNSEHATLDQISEVALDIKIELGRTNMYLEDILKLRKGSVVALDKIAGDAVDIYVNNRLIARGEVLVMNDNFCVRVAELLAGAIPIE